MRRGTAILKLVRRGALVACVSLAGCAPWHDLFQRDRPDEATIAAALRLPAPARTDVAIALGCPTEDDGRPSPCLRCRVAGAAEALRKGRVQAIIFSGGAAHNRYVEAAVMAKAAREQGLPAERLFIEGESLTTWQNLRFAKRIMQAHGYQTALLISAREHLPRARRFADYYGVPAALAACEDSPSLP